jgi:hypothetical protein
MVLAQAGLSRRDVDGGTKVQVLGNTVAETSEEWTCCRSTDQEGSSPSSGFCYEGADNVGQTRMMSFCANELAQKCFGMTSRW